MNVRGGLILLLVAFVGLLLAIGVRTFVRWVKVQSPRSAPLILAVLGLLTAGAVWLTMMEAREGPTFQPNDLVTLQEPIVVRSIPQDRDARAIPCIVDLHEHLGVLDVEGEGQTLRARVESNNTSAASYCPIGSDVWVEVAWLHRMTITRRSPPSPSP